MTPASLDSGDWIRAAVAANLAGEAVAVPSICSAHRDVLAAAMLMAGQHGQPILIEATSNQVNQFGGYTGMQAADFIRFVQAIADAVGFDRRRIAFGGDHLGPQAWRAQSPTAAMGHARNMVASYCRAGFTKIHLDCSQGCAGEPDQLSDELVAERAAELAAVSEAQAEERERLCYIIGTEVPPPGGARPEEGKHVVHPTDPQAAARTIAVHRQTFAAAGLSAAWDRVIGIVVQPGLEFGPTEIDHFDLGQPDQLSPVLADAPGIAFEAHSTDYQRPAVFPALARRHFAVLKVGPALTFAYRKAVYALDKVAGWLAPPSRREPISEVLERLMVEDDRHWRSHYQGSAAELRILRHFGWADRIRYYWAHTEAKARVAALEAAIDASDVVAPLLDQFFDAATFERAEALRGQGHLRSKALIYAAIQSALTPYFFAP